METSQSKKKDSPYVSKAELGLPLNVLFNSRASGMASHVETLYFALNAYRDNALKELLYCHQNQEYEDAADAMQTVQHIDEIICEMVLGLGKIAENNYWSVQAAQDPEQYKIGMASFAKNLDPEFQGHEYVRHYCKKPKE